MDFDISLRTGALPETGSVDTTLADRPGLRELHAVASTSATRASSPSDQSQNSELDDDEWRIATGKRGRGTPSPELDPALKMLRGAIDQMPPGATDLFGDPVFNLPPPPPRGGIVCSDDLFEKPAITTEAFENPLAEAGTSKITDPPKFANSPGLLRDDGGLAAWMNRKPRKGKERALVQ